MLNVQLHFVTSTIFSKQAIVTNGAINEFLASANTCYVSCYKDKLVARGNMNDTSMIREIDNYYLNKEEPNKSCLLALRNIILEQDTKITETQKWGMPCFCYQKRILCYLWIDKKIDEPYILMVEGKLLVHPELEAGKRSKMKIFRVDPNKDLPIKTIKDILGSSLALYRTSMVKLKE